jgi:hypothetical protein
MLQIGRRFANVIEFEIKINSRLLSKKQKQSRSRNIYSEQKTEWHFGDLRSGRRNFVPAPAPCRSVCINRNLDFLAV